MAPAAPTGASTPWATATPSGATSSPPFATRSATARAPLRRHPMVRRSVPPPLPANIRLSSPARCHRVGRRLRLRHPTLLRHEAPPAVVVVATDRRYRTCRRRITSGIFCPMGCDCCRRRIFMRSTWPGTRTAPSTRSRAPTCDVWRPI